MVRATTGAEVAELRNEGEQTEEGSNAEEDKVGNLSTAVAGAFAAEQASVITRVVVVVDRDGESDDVKDGDQESDSKCERVAWQTSEYDERLSIIKARRTNEGQNDQDTTEERERSDNEVVTEPT